MNLDDYVAAVPLGLLRRYLSAHGWRQPLKIQEDRSAMSVEQDRIVKAVLQARGGGERNFDIFLLSESGDDDIEIVLPRSMDSADYARRIQRAIVTLIEIEARSAGDIIQDIRSIGFDVIRSKILDNLVYDETIKLSIASSYISSIKNLLAATATSEIRPAPYFDRVRLAGSDFADNCRFGHTFRGSFGFTVESPVPANVSPELPQFEMEIAPFERRVIQRLAHGIQSVCKAVDRSDVEQIVGESDAGFGANACEHLTELIEITAGAGVAFAFSFSREWPSSDLASENREFVLGATHAEYTRSAAAALRKTPITRPEDIFGRIEKLISQENPADLANPQGDREISVKWSSEDLGKITIRVLLVPSDYLSAIEAHKDGRSIAVSGILERRGRNWWLLNPRGFTVI